MSDKRTVELLLETWTAAIPARWTDFEVQFAPLDAEGNKVENFAGKHLMALTGSTLSGSGKEVDGLFDGLIKAGWAKEVTSTKQQEKAGADE